VSGRIGNQNARKHGFYSLQFPATLAGNVDYSAKSLQPEINLIRSIIERLSLNVERSTDENKQAEYLNLFTLCAARLAVLLRVEAIINPTTAGKDTMARAWTEAANRYIELHAKDKPDDSGLLPGWTWKPVKSDDSTTGPE
jgi:hypothetical protein